MVHSTQYRAGLGADSACGRSLSGQLVLAVPAVGLVASGSQRISGTIEALTLGFLLLLMEQFEKVVRGAKLVFKLFA